MDRLIQKDMIPDTLWSSKDSVLHLPLQLILGWEKLLTNHGLLDRAKEKVLDGFDGGPSKEDTDDHLAWRFTGSSARVMLTMLDPYEDLAEISNVFTRIFSGNKVFLADLPCGSGAASMSILSVLCELRKQHRIPRMPLHIVIVGGEFSEVAQQYANEGLGYLINELEAQAIIIEFEMTDWDVCDKISNTDLIKHLTLKSQDCASKLLMISNFSGFLQRDGKWNEAQKQFDELFRHSRDENSIALWIEPQTNIAAGSSGFMPRVIKWFKEKFSSFISLDDEEQKTYGESSSEVSHPLNDGKFKTHLVVKQFDLPLQRKP